MEMDKTSAFVVLFHFFSLLILVYGNPEGDALSTLKDQFIDPANALQSWDRTLDNPCTWFHVTCNNENRVTRVDLGSANLSGKLVPELGRLRNLQYLELYKNNITGRIPDELGKLTSLLSLDLYQNQLDGDIPATLGKLQKLGFLRLNNNKLTGSIPPSLTTINTLQVLFRNNTGLKSPPPVAHAPPPNSPSSSDTNRSTAAIAGGAAAAAALLFAAPLIALAWWRCRQPPDRFFDLPAEEDPANHLGLLKRFSLRELQVATDSFSKNNILGRGGFGNVYKGRLADGSLVAVKRLKEERKHGDELQFQTEVEIISLALHRNLLRLIGFCMTPTERLLVYPYMVNGSVASCLKDEEFEAVVGDFGLAKLLDYKATHVTTAVRGTIGHIAPEYISTGRSSEKTDVYGYGVMLLELITGQQAYDLARLQKDDSVMLLDWVKGLLEDKKLETLVDADLEVNGVIDDVEKLIQIALLCTQERAIERPNMSEVIRMLEGDGLANRWEEWQKEDISRQKFSNTDIPYPYPIQISSNYTPAADQLSAPR